MDKLKEELNSIAIDYRITSAILENDSESLVSIMSQYVSYALRKSKIKTRRTTTTDYTALMLETDTKFHNYHEILNNPMSSDAEIQCAAKTYSNYRNGVTQTVIQKQSDKWLQFVQNTNDRDIWRKINWNGSCNARSSTDPPPVEELASHFEELYQPPVNEKNEDLVNLEANTFIPALDDPITEPELHHAVNLIKKVGFDFPPQVLQALMMSISPIMVTLMNMLFYVKFPMNLAMSVLSAIPKKGNLSLPQNYSGIQIMPLLACVFDRIIALRLIGWMKVSPEQTAFQKGKGTLQKDISHTYAHSYV